tara:strand:+ start:4390 stop:4584 length:195 start_codon:yes stop_codon:yes gene_type:complete
MSGMFFGASSFNQDLSRCCVSNITSDPVEFANDFSLTEANKPIWGTCPDYNINNIASSNSDYSL